MTLYLIYETFSDSETIQYSVNDQLLWETLKLALRVKLYRMHPIGKGKVKNRKKFWKLN